MDPVSNISGQKVYLWSGTGDTVVNQKSMNDLQTEYQHYGANVVKYDNAFPAEHGWESPDGEPWRTNVEGTLNLLQTARACGVRRMVYASTTEVYGKASGALDENQPFSPLNTYAVTKLAADRLCATFVAEHGAEVCLVHMQGEPATMQQQPRYEDVVSEVRAFLAERIEYSLREGIARERIMIDPGIGFGKNEQHNLELLRRLDELRELEVPIAIGTSRKGFLGRIAARAAGAAEPLAAERRLPGTIATNVLAYERGARVFRVHDVAPIHDALTITSSSRSHHELVTPG